MGLGRDILERDLDVAGLQLYNLRTAVNPSDAVRFDQLGGAYTFTSGLTQTGTTVRGDYITGKAGNQVWSGGLNASDGLTINASVDAVKGPLRFNASGWGFNTAPVAPKMLSVDLSQSVASSGSATLDAVSIGGTTVITGATPIITALGFNSTTFAAPVLNGTPAITHAATVTIAGPPGGTAPITNPYALWIQAGNLRLASLNGLLKATGGVVGVGAAGTDYQAALTPADATISFPTAGTIKVNQLSNKFVVGGSSDAMLTGAQFLGALGTGLVKNTNVTGVLSIATPGTDYEPALTFSTGLTRVSNTVTANISTGIGSNQTAYGGATASGNLTLSSTSDGTKGKIYVGSTLSGFNEVTGQFWLGTTTPYAFASAHFNLNQNAVTELFVTNSNVGTQAGSAIRVGLDPADNTATYLQATILGNAWTAGVGGPLIGPQVGLVEHYPSNGAVFLVSNRGTGATVFTTTLSRTERARLFNNGHFQVGSSTTDQGALFATTGTSTGATIVRHTAVPALITATASATLDAHLWDSATVSMIGGVNITTATGFNWVVFRAPTFTNFNAMTVINSATVYIEGAPIAGSNVFFANRYALWVDADTTRLDGPVVIQTLTGMLKATSGLVSVGAAGTDYTGIITLTAGAGLTGGGDTSTSRTFDVVANADGSMVVNANDIQVGVINDTQHGTRGGGTLHAAATTSTAGFLSAADKSSLANSKFFVGNATNAPASAQNLGALTTGLLKHTVSGGVSTIATAISGTDYESGLTFSTGLTRVTNTVTANLSTGLAGGQTAIGGTAASENLTLSTTSNATKGKLLWGSTSYGFNEATGQLWLGTAAPLSSAQVHVNLSQNAVTEVFTTNANVGNGAAVTQRVGLDPTSDTTKFFAMTMLGTNWSPGAGGTLMQPQAGLLELSASNSSALMVSNLGTGDIAFQTTSSRTERARITNAGKIQVVDLNAGGLVKAAVTTGQLGLAAGGTDYEFPLTFSTGLTRVSNTVTANISTGVSGGQVAIGGTATGNNLTLRSNTSLDGKILLGSTTNGFNESTGNMFLGTSSPLSTAPLHVNKSTNGVVGAFATNANAGANAGVTYRAGLDPTTDIAQFIGITMLGTGFSTSGLLGAQVGLVEHTSTNNANLVISEVAGGAIAFATTSSRTERMRITNGGLVGIGIAPLSTAKLHIDQSQNAVTETFLTNSNAGGAASMAYILGTDPTSDSGTGRFEMKMLGKGFTTSGLLVARTGLISLNSSDTSPLLFNQQGTGDQIWTTTSSITERARLYNRGDWLFSLGGALISTSGTDRAMFDLSSNTITPVANGTAGGTWATVGIMSPAFYQGVSGASSATSIASLYIVSAPLQFGGGFTATNNYSIFCDDGVARFDGHGLVDPVFGGTINTVWEVPDYAPNNDLFHTHNLIPVKVTGVSGVYYIPLVSRSNFGFGQFQ